MYSSPHIAGALAATSVTQARVYMAVSERVKSVKSAKGGSLAYIFSCLPARTHLYCSLDLFALQGHQSKILSFLCQIVASQCGKL